jgi:hypothetical protein
MLDVRVILLSDNYASTAIGPIEVFHSAGRLWNTLNGTRLNARFRVTIASPAGEAVNSPYALGLMPQVSLPRHRARLRPRSRQGAGAQRDAAALAQE